MGELLQLVQVVLAEDAALLAANLVLESWVPGFRSRSLAQVPLANLWLRRQLCLRLLLPQASSVVRLCAALEVSSNAIVGVVKAVEALIDPNSMHMTSARDIYVVEGRVLAGQDPLTNNLSLRLAAVNVGVVAARRLHGDQIGGSVCEQDLDVVDSIHVLLPKVARVDLDALVTLDAWRAGDVGG